jgi:hypothetical protein
MHVKRILAAFCFAISLPLFAADPAKPAAKAPFPYVWGQAYHILPETHNNESGYFSLCEGLDGKVYVGTAKYGKNAYLVEFDPKTQKQRIVLDVHKVCGLDAAGYAAQAKLHTRNFVGPSGKIYVGSKQGYPEKGDTSKYGGGYVLVYDPKTQKTDNLGMPYKGEGVIDVVADESRGILYVVTCEEQHWMRYDVAARKYRELGPLLTPYATTLVDANGRAHAITKDFQLATYDPAKDKLVTRKIELEGQPFKCIGVPTWILMPDQRTAYFIHMSDSTLVEFDLLQEGEVVKPTSRGRLLEGKGFDSRCALTLAPDGKVYALGRINNETKFGAGYLHHLLRYDPKTKQKEDLGVLAVKNPDFFPFGLGPDGKRPPWSHGFHTLPDGTLTPLHHHMALVAARDGTLYATIIAPFALFRIEKY